MSKESKKILIFAGNPVKTSLGFGMADAYEKSAVENGAEIRRFNICDMDFDPVLHQGYNKIQELEKDLVDFQDACKWADHIVFVYPSWWSIMPAKMKGLFDRAFLPGFAFKFVGDKLNPLLTGKTTRIINTIGSHHPLLVYIGIGSRLNALKYGILKACGLKIIATNVFGPTGSSSTEKRKKWLKKIANFAKSDSRI